MIVNCFEAMSIIISLMNDLNTQLRKEFEKAQQARINKNESRLILWGRLRQSTFSVVSNVPGPSALVARFLY